MTKQIPLTQGKVTLVDDDLFYYLNQWKWHARKSTGNTWYAVRYPSRSLGPRKAIMMHNEIMQPSPGIEVDHKDMDGLHNERHNLRYSTHVQNMHNKPKLPNNTSGYKGVFRKRDKWAAQIMVQGKTFRLGQRFETPEEAARAYDCAARELLGDFAQLNFPD
jgi:hypothetical protein